MGYFWMVGAEGITFIIPALLVLHTNVDTHTLVDRIADFYTHSETIL
jgi:hypothetical protein